MYSNKTIIYQDKADWDNIIYLKLINPFWFDNYSVATSRWSIMKIQPIPVKKFVDKLNSLQSLFNAIW